MNAEIENIIVNHDFVELSAEQRAAVREWATSEEEYATMKQIIASAPLLNTDVAPSPKLKASLMDAFAATYPASTTTASSNAAGTTSGNNKKTIYILFRTAAAVAAVLFAVFLIYPLINSSDQANLVAENKVEKKEQPAAINKQKTSQADENSMDKLAENNPEEELPEVAPISPQPQLAPTTGPFDGMAHPKYYNAEDELEILDSDMSLTAPTMDFSPTSAEQVMLNNISSSFSYSGGVVESSAANGSGVDMGHSDRLAIADLPEQSRQVIHEQPELLNLLHTSF